MKCKSCGSDMYELDQWADTGTSIERIWGCTGCTNSIVKYREDG